MAAKIQNTYFKFDPATRTKVYQTFKVDSASVQNSIQNIKEWLKNQPHLPQDIEDDLLEKWLVRGKFKVENTKTRLERYYTLKAVNVKEIIPIRVVLPKETTQMIVPLPQLNDNLERIVIVKMRNSNLESEEDIKKSFKLSLCLNEYSLQTDYNLGHRVVIDFDGMTEDQVRKYTISLAVLARPYLGAYFARIAGLEYFNTPPAIEDLFRKLRFFIPMKMYSRIAVHKDCASLHKNVGKAFLPPEYGGDLKTTMPEILDTFSQEIEKNIESLEEILVKEIADESKRAGDRIKGLKYEGVFGVSGTFRNLNIDL